MKAFTPENRPTQVEGGGKKAASFSAQTDYPVQRKGDGRLAQIKETASKVFQHDVRKVDVELNSSGPRQLKAVATAQKGKVKVDASHSDLSKKDNVKVVGHELKHTVQQDKGLVKPTGSINGVKVNTEKHHESDADRGGEQLARAMG
ncbi:MAG: DUF4157 domain-containing protein [Bacteroidota bacterium]